MKKDDCHLLRDTKKRNKKERKRNKFPCYVSKNLNIPSAPRMDQPLGKSCIPYTQSITKAKQSLH